MLLDEREEQVQKLLSECGTACKRRNLKVIANKSKVMLLEKISVTI